MKRLGTFLKKNYFTRNMSSKTFSNPSVNIGPFTISPNMTWDMNQQIEEEKKIQQLEENKVWDLDRDDYDDDNSDDDDDWDDEWTDSDNSDDDSDDYDYKITVIEEGGGQNIDTYKRERLYWFKKGGDNILPPDLKLIFDNHTKNQ